MSTKPWLFHVEHNARPELVLELLDLVDRLPGGTVEGLVEEGGAMGFAIGTAVRSVQNVKEGPLQRVADLELVDPANMRLSALGAVLQAMTHADQRADLLHYLHWARWRPETPAEYCFSWSYAAVCEWLWQQGDCAIDGRAIAEDVVGRARGELGQAQISFSENSIRGVLHWLRPLEPPVLFEAEGVTRYRRREFCSPLLLLCAVDLLYRQSGVPYRSNLVLSEERVTRLCSIAHLSPDSLDRVLEWAVAQYPILTSPGRGRYVVLDEPAKLEDLSG